MAICHNCLKAIQKLRPQDGTLTTKKVMVTYPILSATAIPECWICGNFLRWLEIKRPNIIEVWLSKPLQVVFAVDNYSGFEEHPGQMALQPFFIELSPVNQEYFEGVCDITMNFILAQGRVIRLSEGDLP